MPIYSARKLHPNELYMVLKGLKALKRVETDLPSGSMAIVGYSVTKRVKKEKHHVDCNIQWLIDLGA